jgi:hypothetical protein
LFSDTAKGAFPSLLSIQGQEKACEDWMGTAVTAVIIVRKHSDKIIFIFNLFFINNAIERYYKNKY